MATPISYEDWIDSGQFIELEDGKLCYHHRGQGFPVLMGHFWGGESWWYSRVIDELAKHFSVYAIDLPGCGQSDVPQLPYGVPQFADALIEMMNKLGIDRAHFVGIHGSGLNAVHIAATRPSRVARLVLDGYPQWNSSEGKELFRETIRPSWMDENELMVPTEGWDGISAGDYDYFPSLKGTEHEICLRRVSDGFMKNRRWAADIIKEALNYDGFASLALVQTATLCIYGEQDWGGGAVGEGEAPLRRLLHGITGAQSAIIPNAGLVPPFEQPAEWTRIVLDFLLKVG